LKEFHLWAKKGKGFGFWVSGGIIAVYEVKWAKKKKPCDCTALSPPKGEFLIRKLAKNIHRLIRQCKANINFK
jgi:hypothetical protein